MNDIIEQEPLTFEEPTVGEDNKDFELLQTIAALSADLDSPPSLKEIGGCYGVTKQWIHARVTKLRKLGWLEENDPGRRVWGVRLTHNGKLVLATGMGAEQLKA